MAKHELVGVSHEWGPLLKGPRGGTYALLSGHKYYLSAEELARAQQHMQKPAHSEPTKKEQSASRHVHKSEHEETPVHAHEPAHEAQRATTDKKTIAELTKALPSPPEFKNS